MSKYIIKNCPVCEFSDWEECTGYLAEGYICNDIHTEIVECQNRTDCVMKQIVELCKRDKNFCVNCRLKADGNIDCIECIEGGRAQLAQDILQLLQIEEVE